MGFMQSDWEVTVGDRPVHGRRGSGASWRCPGSCGLIGKDRYRREAACGAWIGFGCIVVGLLCLLADVGQPLRAMLLPVSFSHFTSWMAFGAWFMFCRARGVVRAGGEHHRPRGCARDSARGRAFARARRGVRLRVASVSRHRGGLHGDRVHGVPHQLGARACRSGARCFCRAGFCASAFYLASAAMAALMSAFDAAGRAHGRGASACWARCALVCGVAFGGLVAWHLSLAVSGGLAKRFYSLSSAGAAEAARTIGRGLAAR